MFGKEQRNKKEVEVMQRESMLMEGTVNSSHRLLKVLKDYL